MRTIEPGIESLVDSAGDPVVGAQIGYAHSAWAKSPVGMSVDDAVATLADSSPVTALGLSMDSDVQNWSLVMIRGVLLTLPDGARVVHDTTDSAYALSSGIVDVVPGWDVAGQLRSRYDALTAKLPALAPLTADDILDLPRPDDVDKEGPEPIGLIIFGTRPMPGEPAWGSMFFVVDHEDGILGGYLYVSPDSYWESEHGSTYVKQVLGADAIAKVVDFADGLTLASVMGVLGQGRGLDGLTPEDAYAVVRGDAAP